MNIHFNNVSCAFENKVILENINLSFETQGVFTFIGKNGTGKSTFLSLLSGLIEPNQGSISVNNIPLQESSDFRQSLCYLTNDMYFEFNDTILKLVERYQSFGKTNFQQKLFDAMIADFNIDPNTKLSNLSTGEKKIHMFITTMAFMPTIIILDEYLDGVDVIHHKLFTKYLHQFCDTNQAKVFIVSHNAHDIYMLSDTLFLVQNHNITPIGHIEDIIAKYNAIQVNTDETILPKLQAANIPVVHFEQFGKIATITYKASAKAETFWQEQSFQFCEQTVIPIERVIEYEFID